MSAISLKSITGITSITTPAGVDNQLTLHNNNTSEAVKLDVAGNLHINNQLAIAGVTTITGSGNALEILGGVVRNRGTTSARFVVNNGSAEGYFGWSGGVLTVGQASATLSLEATGSNHIQLKTNGNERLRITSDGKVGINRDNPDALLHIHNSGATQLPLKVFRNDVGDVPLVHFQAFNNVIGVVDKFVVTTRGRVGVNTDNPQRELHVKPSDNNPASTNPGYIRVEGNGSDQAAILELYHTRGNGSDKWPSSVASVDGGLTLNVANGNNGAPQEKVRITNAGQVRIPISGKLTIGHTNPSARFTVGPTNGSTNVEIEEYGVIRGYNRNSGAWSKIEFEGSHYIFDTDGSEKFRITSAGKVIIGNNGTTFGNAAVQAFIQHGNTAGESGFSSVDTSSVAAGVGGEIAFHGKYNTGAQDYAYYGHIRGVKENATNGNTACALTFHTRPNATAPIERLRIASDGDVGIGTIGGDHRLAVRKDSTTTNYSLSDDPAKASGMVLQNLSPSLGRYAALSFQVSNSTTSQCASILGSSSNSGTAANLNFTVRDSASSSAYVGRIDGAYKSFLIGTTSHRTAEFTHPDGFSIRGDDVGQFQNTVTDVMGGLMNRDGSDGAILGFRREGSSVGHIGVNASTMYLNFGSTNAAAHQLDDYEEGTWTPTAHGYTGSNTSGNCFYTKIGRLVTATFRITWPSLTSSTSAEIRGLPFTCISQTVYTFGGAFSETNDNDNLSMIVVSNSDKMLILRCTSSGVDAQTISEVSGKDFRGTISYFTDS